MPHTRFLNPRVLRVLCAALLTTAGLTTRPAHAERQPNVLVILADDLGWADVTIYGHTDYYETPHIERLAKRGMTFSRAYSSSPLCSPTRASFLTGHSVARHGITAPHCHLPEIIMEPRRPAQSAANQKATVPVSVSRLSTDYYTLAEALRDAGYRTGHFGKWHLGIDPHSPLQHGFEVDIPDWHGPGPAGNFVAPWRYPDFDPNTPNEHIEDRMAEEAVAYMREHKDEPFYLNYWMFSVHAPFNAKPDLIEKYRKTVDPNDPQRCPTYAAMIESMDDAIGTLLNGLDELGIADNTIIIFASDNGGNMYDRVEGLPPTSNAPLRGGKATMFEGGVRGPCVIVWPGEVQPESRSDVPIQTIDFYPTLLDMLGLQPRVGQQFDGVSIVPALQGEAIETRPLFTYFPHSPQVPDWIPPSISVHYGDYKLIRIFHGGEDGAHRYKLFNLADDIGESNNLADAMPGKVAELDAMIQHHIQHTRALVPVRNPAFDPSRYDPSREGVPRKR